MRERIYISGKMGGRLVGDVLAERAEAVRLLKENGFEPLDPAASEGLEKLQATDRIDLKMSEETMRAFVEKDEDMVWDAAAVLVLTGDTPSDGTWFECGLAIYHLDRPVIVVAPKRASGELMGFMNIKATRIVSTIEEGVRALVEMREGEDHV